MSHTNDKTDAKTRSTQEAIGLSSTGGGKGVVVTGCSSGIGLDTAKTLHSLGYRVLPTVRREDDKTPLLEWGFEDVVVMDLADSESVSLAAAQIETHFEGKLFALFNNGAYGQPGAIEDLSRECLEKQFAVNVFGTHQFTCEMLPLLRANGEGRIIQNSSVLGFAAMPMRGAYNASKFALEGLTDTLRLELRGENISVSIIEPGPILTQFRANALQALKANVDFSKSRYKEAYESSIKRLSTPGPAAPFTLGADAVTRRVVECLSVRHPRRRYYVTFPTYLFAVLKRILPTWLLDRVLVKAAAA